MSEGTGAKLVRALSDVLEAHGASSSEGLEALAYLAARALRQEPKPSKEPQAASAVRFFAKVLQITEHLRASRCHALSWQPSHEEPEKAQPPPIKQANPPHKGEPFESPGCAPTQNSAATHNRLG